MKPPTLRSRPRIGVSAAAAVVIAVLVPACADSRASVPATQDGAPRVIAGGTFEASGVVHVSGTNQLLFVDDGRTREIFSMELAPDGRQTGVAVSIPLAADITDPEGITSDGRHVYVVGSQSKKTGFDGDGLVRFVFDPTTRRADRVERIQGLKAWLAANVPELRGIEHRVGDDVLNIEGLAWDPRGHRLLLGLRAPIVNGAALIVPIKLIDSTGRFSRENLRVDGATIHLRLDGAGIRGLEYDERAGAFRLITGAGGDDENRDFHLVEWDGNAGSPLRDILSFDRRLKPEGVTRALLGGRAVSVLVFDVGSFVVMD
jgi:hypothetical protein